MTAIDATSRFRFAPSPTGMLHVGGGRTALFNWLLAQGCGGKLILRVEDTDRERSTKESVDAILEGMEWLGLSYDEGPFYQSERDELYNAAADRLLEAGHAYPCFCTQERLDELREKAKADGANFVYDGCCSRLSKAEADKRVAAGEPHVIRFRVTPGGTTSFEDMIGGMRRMENDRVGDFVLRRSDGTPIYHLTVVVDDHEMGITHVVRGDDHLSNTPRQVMLIEALGWNVPAYAHLPLIKGPDGGRLSKRHGATSVMEFEKQGYHPEALFNFLALLGWSLDSETEVFTKDELIKGFSLDRVNKSAAVFDTTKLNWMNGLYMRSLPLQTVVDRARKLFPTLGVPTEHLEEPRFTALVQMQLERSKTLVEMREDLDYFFVEKIESYDAKGVKKVFKGEDVGEILEKTQAALNDADFANKESLETTLKALAESMELKFGKIANPLRLALSGRTATPGIYEVLMGIGKEGSLKRLADAQEWLAKNANPEATT